MNVGTWMVAQVLNLGDVNEHEGQGPSGLAELEQLCTYLWHRAVNVVLYSYHYLMLCHKHSQAIVCKRGHKRVRTSVVSSAVFVFSSLFTAAESCNRVQHVHSDITCPSAGL